MSFARLGCVLMATHSKQHQPNARGIAQFITSWVSIARCGEPRCQGFVQHFLKCIIGNVIKYCVKPQLGSQASMSDRRAMLSYLFGWLARLLSIFYFLYFSFLLFFEG